MGNKIKIFFTLIIYLILISKITNAQIVQLCEGKSTTVMKGEYNVMNNVWGAKTSQCIEVDLDSSYFKVILSEHNNGNNVAAYPAIFKGCHWGWCTTNNNPFPMQIKFIESAPIRWSIDTKNSPGTWNAAMDIWFAELPTGNDYSAEMMIWLDYNGGAAPAGSKVATVDIGGIRWDLYFVAWSSWNYIAFKAVNPIESVELDLRDFINESLRRGYLYSPWYLHAVEAGFEIWSNGVNLTTKYFSANITGTLSPLNFAPLPFRIQTPADKAVINSFNVVFKWQQTIDPDLDEIEYILHIKEPDKDTTISKITQNNFSFEGINFFKPNNSYIWYVEATDGEDTTKSTTERSFTISNTTDVNNLELPVNFYLYQNYPNPFNPTTVIGYQLSAASKIVLKVYDVLGREVAELINEIKQPGKYEINFDASELSPGVYFYQLRANNFLFTRKMILNK